MELAEKILQGLSISKPQRKFLLILFTTILGVRGKVNFRNLSRYSDLSEKTYSRQFGKAFDAIAFNRQLINKAIGTESERIVAFDPCFIPKAGKKTYGRDFFWNGSHTRAEKGLEISTFSIVDVERHTGFALSVRQTVPTPESSPVSSSDEKGEEKTEEKIEEKIEEKAGKSPKKKTRKSSKKKAGASTPEEGTLIDAYLQHLGEVQPHLLDAEKQVVVDGYFAKKKWVDGVDAFGLHTIGKLRCDADMRYFYTGPKREKGSGQQKTYDGKVDWQDLRRFHYVTYQDGLEIYTRVLNHVSLKRTLRVVVVLDVRDPDKERYALLFSTDTDLDALAIYRYYKARFQIEFLFRDAKQFTGLTDCQARDANRLHFHFNASLTTLNIAKAELLQAQDNADPIVYSIASVKACYFNEHYLQIISSKLGLDLSSIKNSPQYTFLREYGRIAA